jgi:hypothetical protein
MEEAKHVHTSLRKSAGIIKFVQDTLVPQLAERVVDGSGGFSVSVTSRVARFFLVRFTKTGENILINGP